MPGRPPRIAPLGAAPLLPPGIFSAGPAGASDGAQADATVQTGTADAVSQTLDLVNQACVDATRVSGASAATDASGGGITVASRQSATGLNLVVSLPALTGSLPALGSLPLLGSASGRLEAAPLTINCATSSDGTGIGVSAAGVDALVNAIAPGLDISGLVPAGDVAASTSATANAPATSARATAPAGPAAATAGATGPSPAVPARGRAPP